MIFARNLSEDQTQKGSLMDFEAKFSGNLSEDQNKKKGLQRNVQ